ncbi:MAG: hypothetical protein ACOY33_01375 [Pseudomonadota bacterium]
MTLRRLSALLLLSACALPAYADAWREGLYAQQYALYRLAGTFYMSTHEDAQSGLLDSLPARTDAYRKALDTCDDNVNGNRERSQQIQAIREAWAPVESLVTRDIQKIIGTEQKKYINNGAFNAFQRATDVHNLMPALETALGKAVTAAGGRDQRQVAMLRSAVAVEALAAQYARMATGFFEDKAGATLATATRDFETAMAEARQKIDDNDPIQRVTINRIEARWKFVQPVLAKPADNRPRIVYRYLGEIGDDFMKLAKAP